MPEKVEWGDQCRIVCKLINPLDVWMKSFSANLASRAATMLGISPLVNTSACVGERSYLKRASFTDPDNSRVGDGDDLSLPVGFQ
jgi:hypothetical protein